MYQLGLEIAGFTVAAAYDGAQALARARALNPSAIVLDLRLPDISGWAVCARLKADVRTRQIPIVILTAAASPTLPQEAADAGCTAVLVKPCFPDVLTETVRQVIEGALPHA